MILDIPKAAREVLKASNAQADHWYKLKILEGFVISLASQQEENKLADKS